MYSQGQVTNPQASDAWIEPDGTFHWVSGWGHNQAAHLLGDETGGRQLESEGWVHLSAGIPAVQTRKVTQAQVDTLFEVLKAYRQKAESGAGFGYQQVFETLSWHYDHLLKNLS